MSWRSKAVLPAVVFLSLWHVAMARAETLELKYEIYGGGFHLLSFEVAIDETAESYRIDSAFRTRGLLDVVVGFLLRSATAGRVDGAELLPAQYAANSKFRGRIRNTRIDYAPDGRVAAEISPSDKDKRTKVEPHQMLGTVDALTATLRASRHVALIGNCTQMVPVFDGRRRYDLFFEDHGVQELKRSSYSAFSGPARACRVKQLRIAGFSTDPADQEKTEEAALWIAPVLAGAPPMPVRIELDTSWGYIYVHLAEVHGTAGSRRLARD
jgi:hypothetical protein